MSDALWRVFYRVVYRGARLVWRVQRPHHVGAVLAAWLDDRILIVRQSYRSTPYWPGGGVSQGEAPSQAVRRELAEELGLTLSQDQIALWREMEVEWEHRHETVSVFETRFEAEPRLRVDNREIVGAEFVDPLALFSRKDLPPYMKAYLEERLLPSSS